MKSLVPVLEIPAKERAYLRELARKQAEYAALAIMAQRKRMWYDLNDGKAGTLPPVIIETNTFDADFMPPGVFHCETKTGRTIEEKMLRHIRNHELIDDDKVVPDDFIIGWFTSIDAFGVSRRSESITGDHGQKSSRFFPPLNDLKRDFHMLKPPACEVDKEGTMAYRAFLEDLLGNILPIRNTTGFRMGAWLSGNAFGLLGMEALYMAMYEAPDDVHRLMAYLRDNRLAIMRWAESEGLLIPNNGNDIVVGSNYGFTKQLPTPQHKPGATRLCDMWGAANSQETIGISPAMFHEFCFPYYRDVCEPLGQLYFGCCEPASPLWDDIRLLPHLKKVSISRWCDERFMGEALRGTDIVYSRKPDPNFLSVDLTLNEDAWTAHIGQTLEATRGVFLEFIVRDVMTVHGNLANPRRAVEITRRQIDRYYRD